MIKEVTQIASGVIQLITILLSIFKFCGVVSWSWLWVLSPLWGGICIILLICAVLLIISVIEVYILKKTKK